MLSADRQKALWLAELTEIQVVLELCQWIWLAVFQQVFLHHLIYRVHHQWLKFRLLLLN
jgi:hypothetical protein